MAKRKRQEDKLTLHRCTTELAKPVNDNSHEEIVTPTTIVPILNSHPMFVLDQASLNIGFVHKKRKILWGTEDSEFLLKKGKNPKDYRPDVLYRALCEILDSTLNKKGRVGAVFVKTDSGVLFEVKPHVRIPRTMKRFCGLMLELLDKSCIRAKESGEVLLRVLKGSLTQHLPQNALMIGLSQSSTKIVDVNHYLSAANNDSVLCFVIGAMAKGKVNKDGMDDYISVSNLPLSARYCTSIIRQALEDKWKAYESKQELYTDLSIFTFNEAVIFGAMTGKRKASEGLLQPCSRNEKSIDADEKSICETKNEHEDITLCGIPLAISSQATKSGAIFVLDKASLVLAHVGKRYQILSSDDHADYLRKKKLNPYDYRPDIVHEALLLIWESRLHMLGRVKAVYIRTDDGALIKVEPNTLIPESLTEFCHMMAMLRQKLFIKAKGKREKLLRLVENPVTKHLPVNSRKIGLSFSSQKSVDIGDYVNSIGSHEDVVFVVGTMAYGKIESNYIEDLISVSDCHLSASSCLSSICIAMERKWNIH